MDKKEIINILDNIKINNTIDIDSLTEFLILTPPGSYTIVFQDKIYHSNPVRIRNIDDLHIFINKYSHNTNGTYIATLDSLPHCDKKLFKIKPIVIFTKSEQYITDEERKEIYIEYKSKSSKREEPIEDAVKNKAINEQNVTDDKDKEHIQQTIAAYDDRAKNEDSTNSEEDKSIVKVYEKTIEKVEDMAAIKSLIRIEEQNTAAAKIKADEEAAKKKAEEAAKIKADEEVAKKKADEEAAKIKADEEAAKKKADEEAAAKIKADEEAAKIKADEEAAAKIKADEEAAKIKADEEAAKIKADEEAAKKKADEEAAKKKADEEVAKKKAEEEAAKKKADEEVAKKKAEEEADKKKADEAAADKPKRKPLFPSSPARKPLFPLPPPVSATANNSITQRLSSNVNVPSAAASHTTGSIVPPLSRKKTNIPHYMESTISTRVKQQKIKGGKRKTKKKNNKLSETKKKNNKLSETKKKNKKIRKTKRKLYRQQKIKII